MWLIYGEKGFVGSALFNGFAKLGIPVEGGSSRLDNPSQIEAELLEKKPERVICCVGRTCGGNYNTIEYLESGKPDITKVNLRDNLFSPVVLGLICARFGIHMTYIGTGCIFEYETPDQPDNASEDTAPNFFGSNYSVVKGYTDLLLHQEPLCSTVLNLRIRMPVVAENNPRNFITKIVSYSKIADFPNSITVLPDMIPHMASMITRQVTGTVNCTNPGALHLSEILKLYQKHADPFHKWDTFPSDQLIEMKKKRSNTILDTTLLTTLCPSVKNVEDALVDVFKVYE